MNHRCLQPPEYLISKQDSIFGIGKVIMDQLGEIWWLILGMVLFIGIILYVFRRGGKKGYDKDAKIPLDED